MSHFYAVSPAIVNSIMEKPNGKMDWIFLEYFWDMFPYGELVDDWSMYCMGSEL